MKFMSWTLSRPSTAQFDEYYKLKEGEAWNSDKYELVNADAFSNYYNERVRGFVETLENHPEKFYAMGMHEFGISDNGDIFSMGHGQIAYPNGYFYNNPNMRVLNEAEDDIERPVPTSLRYFMHKQPNIRWAIQFLATANSSGDRVTSLLNNQRKPLFTAVESADGTEFVPDRDSNGDIIYVYAQDEFIRQAKLIAELYLDAGFPIADIEIDMEKTWSEVGEDQLLADLLARVKREICKPLGLGLRVNLFAMTGDYTPDYYGWHNYATVAQAEVDGEQAVDEFQLMTYDFSWGGSSAGASTPLWWLESVLAHVQDLQDRGLWDAQKVYIGNAGYGRRWSLNEDRLGVTFDFKQMVQLQNGLYIHNDGETIYPDPDNPDYSEFPFRDQDFIPFAGYNDAESDYQINYPHVYDRFNITPNGGATFDSVNTPDSGEYVTNYSLTQRAIFTDVLDYKTEPDEIGGRVEERGSVSMPEVQGDLPNETWNRYQALPAYIHPDTGEPTGNSQDAEGRIAYYLNATGTYRIILQVTFPFYDKNETTVYVNGEPIDVGTGDWYSINLMQKNHFYDLGEFTSTEPASVVIRNTQGVVVGGAVACKSFNHNLTGGTTSMVSSTYPFVRRGERQGSGDIGIVDAQFPDSMDLVAEVLRRSPRPAMIWEDVYASHVNAEGEGYNLLSHEYYTTVSNGGYSSGNWDAHIENDYSHARTDSRDSVSTFALNHSFSSNIHLAVEMAGDSADRGSYGISLLRATGGGYSINMNFSRGRIELINNGAVETSVAMSETLVNMRGIRLTMETYVLDGKISFRVNDRFYITEYTPADSLDNVVFGVTAEDTRARMYRYSISSLDRFERMERLQLTVDGEVVNTFGAVERSVGTDEYGLLKYTGYPADILDAVNRPTADTILDTEVARDDSPNAWSSDYENSVLASIQGWAEGAHDVSVQFIDVGIWFRRFYVGDSEGMSISYNSDKVAFIRTAELINEYDCRGIAMWTLGQEDPTIYTYLPDSWER